MEKIKFQFNQPKDVSVEIDGQTIMVRPYLTLNEMGAMINQYLETYFHSETKTIGMDLWNAFDAEWAMKLMVVDFCTNLPATEGDFENIFYSDIFEIIRDKIENYWDFAGLLDEILQNVKSQIAQKNSVGAMLDSLYSKAELLVQQLIDSTENLTPEQLMQLKETGSALVDKIAENPIVKEVFKESGK
jgi:hypothetical protein